MVPTFLTFLFAALLAALTTVAFWQAVVGLQWHLAYAEDFAAPPKEDLRETINVIETRIEAWERAAKQEGIRGTRLISGLYGSTFLKLNAKALDQDYLCVFDVGVLATSSSKEQARELMERLNALTRVITQVNRERPNTPSLYLYDHGPVDPYGNLHLSADTVGLIERQLDALKSRKPPRLAFPDARGRLIPSEIYPREIILPINTRLKMATNTARHPQELFRGIRDISFQMFFSVGVKVKDTIVNLNISPLYDKEGRPIPMFEAVRMDAFLSPHDAEVYRKILLHMPLEQTFTQSSLDLYLASLREYQAGNYLKQTKRLHGSYEGMQSAFSPSEQREIETVLGKWLQSDWAVIAADISEQADMWLKADAAMAAQFIEAGSLNGLVGLLRRAVTRIDHHYPHLATDREELKLVIEQINLGIANPSLFRRLKSTGTRLLKAMQPPANDISRLSELFSKKFSELGFSQINVYGIRGERLTVLEHEIIRAGFQPEKVNLPPEGGGLPKIGGYDYVVVNELRDSQPIKTVLLRSPAGRNGRTNIHARDSASRGN